MAWPVLVVTVPGAFREDAITELRSHSPQGDGYCSGGAQEHISVCAPTEPWARVPSSVWVNSPWPPVVVMVPDNGNYSPCNKVSAYADYPYNPSSRWMVEACFGGAAGHVYEETQRTSCAQTP